LVDLPKQLWCIWDTWFWYYFSTYFIAVTP
jgi:hypothetical protein